MNCTLVLTIAAVLVVGGCGEDAGESAATTTAPEELDLTGTYEAELGSSGDLLVAPNPEGRWLLEISGDGAVLETPRGDRFAPGDPIRIEGNTITFAPDPECPTQQGQAGDGVYEFEVDDNAVTFVEVHDTCRDRAFVMTSARWAQTAG